MDITHYNGICKKDITFKVKKDKSFDTQITCVRGVLQYTPTEETCTVIFVIDTVSKIATCKTVYRKVRGVPSYYFFMSKETISVEEAIREVLRQIEDTYDESWKVEIPTSLNLQNRFLRKEEYESEDEYIVSGTWEDDNIFHK